MKCTSSWDKTVCIIQFRLMRAKCHNVTNMSKYFQNQHIVVFKYLFSGLATGEKTLH